MLLALLVVLGLMIPEIKLDNLMAMPIDNALLISASPVFFTAFGFHGSIPCLNKYLEGDIKALRISIIFGSAITLISYILWQCSTHGVLSQTKFLEILHQDPTLNGLIEAVRIITRSSIIAGIVKIFSALALITSFLGVALGLLECIEDLLKRACNISANRLCLGF
ncbi:tyrosine-specific transport protein-2 [Rodentibacter pneumotropicus]|uniref:Tyrosine-specific transport protein-2 n=2 Tax=Rodentibacter pneumotropicus TaxID=758 RepID=A0A448MJD5_9PAST|nr:tyrosine-specific transport protein-2 [Rodentibacter pneumotropicus]